MTTPVGICAFGCYVPRSRLGRAEIARAWGRAEQAGGGKKGRESAETEVRDERSVALHDEDALTMAVEAAAEALRDSEPKAVGALYLATTSGPFAEKAGADVVAAALDLRGEVATADFTGSTRAFTVALRAACDAVRAGSCRNVLVVASDLRLAEPGSALEPLLGDAAAAVIVGAGAAVAEIEQAVSASDEFSPTWRLGGERFLRGDDDKVAAEAYVAGSLRVARRALELAARDPADIGRVLTYAPDPASFRALLKASGMGEKFHTRTLLAEVGNSGAASLPLQLCGLLESAGPGERALLCNWAGGGDAVLLRCAGATADRQARPLSAWLDSRVAVSYQDYLRFRDLLVKREGAGLDPFASLTAERRESRQILRLHGGRCEGCGSVLYPVRPACRKCGAAGPFPEVRLGRRGRVVTWNRDHVYPGPGSPVANVVVDLDGGGRILTQLAEGEPAVGLPVELSFRRIHEGRGLPHYWWKARTVRGAPEEERKAAAGAVPAQVAP